MEESVVVYDVTWKCTLPQNAVNHAVMVLSFVLLHVESSKCYKTNRPGNRRE